MVVEFIYLKNIVWKTKITQSKFDVFKNLVKLKLGHYKINEITF